MKKKFLSMLLIIALIASLAVAFVACGDDKDGFKIKDGMSIKQIMAAIVGTDINSMTCETSIAYDDETYNYVTKFDKNSFCSTVVASDGEISSTCINYTKLEDGKIYVVTVDEVGTVNESSEYKEINLGGANLTEELFVESGLNNLFELLLMSLYDSYSNSDFIVSTKNNSIVFTSVEKDNTTTYTYKDINTTTVEVPEILYNYKNLAVPTDNGIYETYYDYDAEETYACFTGLRYGVDSYQVLETYNDKAVKKLNIYSNYSDIKTLTIPKSITEIENLYSLARIETVKYNGTKEEFEDVNYSYYYGDNFDIICSNGTFTIVAGN